MAVLAATIISQSTMAQACAKLEKLRSLHAKREACALFASSILAHPLGSGDAGGGLRADANNQGAIGDDDNDDNNKVCTGGLRDTLAYLSYAAQPLGVLTGDAPNASVTALALALALGSGKGPLGSLRS